MDNRQDQVLKLRTMIAATQVAIRNLEHAAKYDPGMADRWYRMAHKMRTTLGMCQLALQNLEAGKPGIHVPYIPTEVTNIQEYEKFKQLPPISREEIASVDLMDLTKRLQE